MNPANSQEALAQLQKTQTSAQSPESLLAQQQAQLGVNSQRDTVGGLRGAINSTTKLLQQVAPSVMGRTQNSLVTNAQANRQIANEQAPIQTNLANQSTAYGQAAQDLADLENRASTTANTAYAGQQDRIGYLQNIYNNLYQREQDAQARDLAQQQFQEQQRQFNLTPRGGSGGGLDLSSILGMLGGGQQDPVSSLFSGYNPSTDRRYTEQVVIPTLQSKYGYTPEQASKAAYDYRKAKFGE